jgi:ADP-ribose pyrophosphatase YjhB (NUDIX family)
MKFNNSPQWLNWAREIQAISQTGLTYATVEYDKQRYLRLAEIAAEILSSQTTLEKESVVNNFSTQLGYATPKIDVRGAVVRDDRLLLVQERTDSRWCMPGGWADVGDIPSNMVIREVWEESGFQVKPTKVVAVYDANRGGRPLEFFHAFKIIFLCKILNGEPRTSSETSAVDFFDFDKLPPLSWERTNERHVKEVLAHTMDLNRPTAFD